MSKEIKVTLVRSLIGCTKQQRATVTGLGLKKIHQSIVLLETDSVNGMINKIKHMLKVDAV